MPMSININLNYRLYCVLEPTELTDAGQCSSAPDSKKAYHYFRDLERPAMIASTVHSLIRTVPFSVRMTSSPARQRHFGSAWLLRPSSAAMKVNQPPDEMDVYPSNADRDLQQHPITRRCVAKANLTIWGGGEW